ncbi:MAG: glycosyltransferase [Flavobacteriaceae bacterium]|nr:glycosyltransferase [Flavobacteriaceae bacterium]
MKKICFIDTIPTWGGGENWQVETMLALKDEFELISISHPQGELQKKVKDFARIIPFKVGNLSVFNPLKLYKAYSVLKELAPDVVIFNTSPDFKVFTLPARWAKIPSILYWRANGKPLSPHFLNKYLLQKGITDFLPCSDFIGKSALLKDKNLIPSAKITVLYNSINIAKWDAMPTEKLLEKQKGVTYFGCLGRLSKEKGLLFLPEIVQKLQESHSNFKILIAGTGDLEEELKAKIKETKTERFFEFLGFLRNGKSFMETIDCLLLPSLWEGLPTVAIESMASFKPVISFEVAGNPEVVLHQKTGLLVTPFDTEIFAKAMAEIIENPTNRAEMGQQGRVLVEKVFSQEETLKELKKKFR